VGSLEREPAFVDCLRRRVSAEGLAGRVHLAGAMSEPELERSYEAADLLVLPSRAETYGMVVTEALARGLPVVASDVGGVEEALGHGGAGATPGRLVPADDPSALAGALRAWLGRPETREAWRRTAHERRASLMGWQETTSVLAGVLDEVAR